MNHLLARGKPATSAFTANPQLAKDTRNASAAYTAHKEQQRLLNEKQKATTAVSKQNASTKAAHKRKVVQEANASTQLTKNNNRGY